MEAKAKQYTKDVEDQNDSDRNRLVRVPKFVDSSIFGGWGIKL